MKIDITEKERAELISVLMMSVTAARDMVKSLQNAKERAYMKKKLDATESLLKKL
jgi:hypothetical protein